MKMKILYYVLNIITMGFSDKIVELHHTNRELTKIMNRCHDYEKILFDYVVVSYNYNDMLYKYNLFVKKYSFISSMMDNSLDYGYFRDKIEYIEKHFNEIPYFKNEIRKRNLNFLL